jgi:hypothetical protein
MTLGNAAFACILICWFVVGSAAATVFIFPEVQALMLPCFVGPALMIILLSTGKVRSSETDSLLLAINLSEQERLGQQERREQEERQARLLRQARQELRVPVR